MSQNVQELINKIKEEGLQASEQKTRELEAAAKKRADQMIADAKHQAEKIIADARFQQQKLEASTRASLEQAARDTVLTLKQTLNDLLMRIIQQDVRDALGKEQMSGLIMELTKQFMNQGQVDIGLSPESRAQLEKSLLAELQKQVKGSIRLHTADDLTGGFTISFDGNKSCFDFSEGALADFLSRQVNEFVKGILSK